MQCGLGGPPSLCYKLFVVPVLYNKANFLGFCGTQLGRGTFVLANASMALALSVYALRMQASCSDTAFWHKRSKLGLGHNSWALFRPGVEDLAIINMVLQCSGADQGQDGS